MNLRLSFLVYDSDPGLQCHIDGLQEFCIYPKLMCRLEVIRDHQILSTPFAFHLFKAPAEMNVNGFQTHTVLIHLYDTGLCLLFCVL